MHKTIREHRALGQLSAQARGGGMHPVPHMKRRYIRGAKDVEAASLITLEPQSQKLVFKNLKFIEGCLALLSDSNSSPPSLCENDAYVHFSNTEIMIQSHYTAQQFHQATTKLGLESVLWPQT